MKTNDTANTAPLPDWPLSAANHKIAHAAAQEMIAAFKPSGLGGYFTLATINSLINPVNAGIRYYFTLHNDTITIMLTGVQKIDTGRYDDLFNLKLAVSDNLNLVAPATSQLITRDEAARCNRNYRASANFADGRKGGMFGIAAIKSITALAGCAGIRFCFAKDSMGIKTIVLYGVDTTGNNLTAYVGDQNCPCPNFCGAVNVLNS